MKLKAARRFTDHREGSRHLVLDVDHPSIVSGRTLFRARVTSPLEPDRLFKSGQHSRKIGSHATKGRWAGMPIFTLTLEERATCPRTCSHWHDCYGNKMNWSARLEHGPVLERRISAEVAHLSMRYPGGFIVRLHVLGDFYSVGYVRLWDSLLDRHEPLRIYGYTARNPYTSAIGRRLAAMADKNWDRFSMRFSDHAGPSIASAMSETKTADGIVCPAQTGASACCGTCCLCWNTRKTIIFKTH